MSIALFHSVADITYDKKPRKGSGLVLGIRGRGFPGGFFPRTITYI